MPPTTTYSTSCFVKTFNKSRVEAIVLNSSLPEGSNQRQRLIVREETLERSELQEVFEMAHVDAELDRSLIRAAVLPGRRAFHATA